MVSTNRLSALWHWLARSTCYARYVVRKDVYTFQRRYAAEGLAFAARHLPDLRRIILTALETGRIDEDAMRVARFGKKQGSILPRFLYGAFSAVFTDSGELRHDADVGAIDALLCLTAVFGKIVGGHTPASDKTVLDSFVATERELGQLHLVWEQSMEASVAIPSGIGERTQVHLPMSLVVSNAARLVREVLADANPREIKPYCGSGKSACGLPVHARFANPRFVESIDRLWHYSEFWTMGKRHLEDVAQPWQTDPYVPQAQVLLVPKDSRGQRLISCEPRETMWIQQGAMGLLYETVEAHQLTRGEVNFTDQTVNQRLARQGSMSNVFPALVAGVTHNGMDLWATYGNDRSTPRVDNPWIDWASLDLKDASDRVSMQLVDALFPNRWSEALRACRSRSTVLPDGRVVAMFKHAPMGSATCFPVMALCVWAIAKAVINLTNTYHSTEGRNKNVFVYGDDIIVPAPVANGVSQALELVGLLVNRNKSFSQGSFRESCGGEYFLGKEVTPIRLRCMPNDDASSKLEIIAFANNARRRYGDYETASLRRLLRRWYGPIPEREVQTGAMVVDHEEAAYPAVFNVDWVNPRSRAGVRRRWNSHFQRWEYRILAAKSRDVKYPVDHWCGLLRWFIKPNTRRSLGLDALPKRVHYKYRWAHL